MTTPRYAVTFTNPAGQTVTLTNQSFGGPFYACDVAEAEARANARYPLDGPWTFRSSTRW